VTHYADDDLVLFYYGDREAPADVGAHLSACIDCQARFQDLAQTLGLVMIADAPARDDWYGVQLWNRIEPRLSRGGSADTAHSGPFWRRPWFRPLSWAAAATLLLVSGFVAGRMTPVAEPPADVAVAENAGTAADAGGAAARRVLLLSVADHLERSDRVLTDIVNTAADGDISDGQQWAADLVEASRLYRRDALANDERSVADVLDELERTLVEIVHGPSTITQEQLDQMHRRFDSAALLFRVRVLSGELRRQMTPAPASPSVSQRISG
jgi:hypothetical protein